MAEQTGAAVEQMTMPKHGEFCWNDLATNRPAECKRFYTQLFGWQYKESGLEGMNYTEISLDGRKFFGGMWDTNQQCEGADGETMPAPPPHWMTWIAVDDIEASAEKVIALGGSICVPPSDIPNTGRYCVANDPSGAVFSMIKFFTPAVSE